MILNKTTHKIIHFINNGVIFYILTKKNFREPDCQFFYLTQILIKKNNANLLSHSNSD